MGNTPRRVGRLPRRTTWLARSADGPSSSATAERKLARSRAGLEADKVVRRASAARARRARQRSQRLDVRERNVQEEPDRLAAPRCRSSGRGGSDGSHAPTRGRRARSSGSSRPANRLVDRAVGLELSRPSTASGRRNSGTAATAPRCRSHRSSALNSVRRQVDRGVGDVLPPGDGRRTRSVVRRFPAPAEPQPAAGPASRRAVRRPARPAPRRAAARPPGWRRRRAGSHRSPPRSCSGASPQLMIPTRL